MKMINDSNNTHYVVHILIAQAALASWPTAHWKFSLIFVGFTASQHSSSPRQMRSESYHTSLFQNQHKPVHWFYKL